MGRRKYTLTEKQIVDDLDEALSQVVRMLPGLDLYIRKGTHTRTYMLEDLESGIREHLTIRKDELIHSFPGIEILRRLLSLIDATKYLRACRIKDKGVKNENS